MTPGVTRLNPADFKNYVDAFNADDNEDVINLIQ